MIRDSIAVPSSAAARQNQALRIGTVAGALYLSLLPFNHLTAAKNLCAATAFACALFLWWRGEEKRLPMVPAFAMWFVVAAISSAWSHDLDASLSAIWRDIVKTALVFFTFFALARAQASLGTIVRIAVVGATAFSALAVRDFVQNGLWDNVITAARYDVSVDALNWIVFIGMMLPLLRRQPQYPLLPWFGLMTLALLAVTGIMTQSRSFNLSIVLCTVLFAAMNYRRIVRRKITLAIAVGVIAIGFVLGIALLDRPITAYLDRWLLYSTVWQKIAANLWQGTGFGHETDQAWYHATFDHFAIPGAPSGLTHPHNIVLSYMDQLGIWGLLVLAIIFWSIGKELWSAMRCGDPWRMKLGQAGMVLLLATLLSNTFNFYFARQHLWMFFAMLGLYFGWIRGKRQSLQ